MSHHISPSKIYVFNKEYKFSGCINQQQKSNRIFSIRGFQVMLDIDLAELYRVETKVLNQAVKRNKERFPESFCYLLNNNEMQNLKSQFATSSWGGKQNQCCIHRAGSSYTCRSAEE